MNARRLLTAAAAAALMLSATVASAGEDVAWVKDLTTARAVSQKTGKPILVVFGAEWCGYCKKMERTTLAHPQTVALINERFVPVHLDLTDQKNPTAEKRVAGILKVEKLPTSVVLTSDADLLGRISGYQSSARFYEKLTTAEQVGANIRMAGATQQAK